MFSAALTTLKFRYDMRRPSFSLCWYACPYSNTCKKGSLHLNDFVLSIIFTISELGGDSPNLNDAHTYLGSTWIVISSKRAFVHLYIICLAEDFILVQYITDATGLVDLICFIAHLCLCIVAEREVLNAAIAFYILNPNVCCKLRHSMRARCHHSPCNI